MEHVSSNNRIAAHLEAQTSPLESATGKSGPGDVQSAPPISEDVSSEEIRVSPGGTRSVATEIPGTRGNRPTSSATPALGDPHEPPPNPFDPARLRMGQDFGEKTGVKKLITTIRVDKPSKETFVRTHPDPSFRLPTHVIELKADRELYLVDPGLWPALAGEATFTPKLLVFTVTRQGVLLLWPIRLPGPDGKIDDWNKSALEAVDVARDHWVRVTANMHQGAYDILVAGGITAEPEFPDLSMGEVLQVAFKERHIDGWDHPVLRKLRGEF